MSCYELLWLVLNGSFTRRLLPLEVDMPTPKRLAQTQVSLQTLANDAVSCWTVKPSGDTEQTAFSESLL